MSTEPRSGLHSLRSSPLLPRVAGSAVIVVGLAVILGWILDVAALKTVLPGLSSMKLNTAICFVLAGASLTLSQSLHPRASLLARACALTAGAIASATLAEYASGRSFGIDQLLIRDYATGPLATYPGRMGVNTALAFVLLAASLFSLATALSRSHFFAELSALAAAFVASIALVGYAYSVPSSTGFASYTQMAIHTTMAFLVLVSGVIVAARGPAARLISSEGPGGLLARRLLPVIVLAPIAIGWLMLAGRRVELYNTELGTALVVVATMVLLGLAVLGAATALNHADDARRRTADALRVNEARLRHVLGSSTAVIYSTNVVGRELALNWVSDNVTELFGYQPQELLQPTWWLEHLHPEDRPLVLAERPTILAKGRLSLEYRFRHGDGNYRWVHDESRLLQRPDGQPPEVFGAWLDISDQKRLEGQYRHAQRMEVVGRLAGGVAHDFNNLLTVITSVSELLLLDLGPDSPMRDDVKHIQKAAENAAGLTRQLLAFSRQQVLQPKAIDLTEVVVGTEKLLRRLIGEDIELVIRLGAQLGVVRADPGQVEQIITNLAVNARDAMPEGGTLTIETTNADLDEAFAQTHPAAQPGRYVMLSVSDTGRGMDEVTKARLFEPYFTTKEIGKGTGLGLATVYGIVKQAGGSVWVYSEPGQGATFKIYLPRIDEPAEPQAEAEAAPMLRGSETILVVEDTAAVRATMCKALARYGYSVMEAPDGEEALRLAAKRHGPIHLVVTDVVMPKMGGGSLGRHLKQVRPDLKVLYMSGYPDDEVIRHGVLEADIVYIQKPFTLDALLNKVRGVLDGRE